MACVRNAVAAHSVRPSSFNKSDAGFLWVYGSWRLQVTSGRCDDGNGQIRDKLLRQLRQFNTGGGKSGVFDSPLILGLLTKLALYGVDTIFRISIM
jgi:hypothetical protein